MLPALKRLLVKGPSIQNLRTALERSERLRLLDLPELSGLRPFLLLSTLLVYER